MLVDNLPELPRFSRRRSLGVIAGFVGGVSIFGCGPSREPQPPAPRLPTPPVEPDPVVAQPTTPPEPEPTSTSGPPETTATPRPPEPTRAPELPRILREAPVYGRYTGDLFVIEGGQRVIKGSILLSHLPNDSFFLAYNIKEPCSGGQRRTPIAIIPREKITGAGFLADNRDTFATPSLMSPQAIGGSLRVKELKISESVCSAIEGLSIGTRLEPGTPSKDDFIGAYLKLSQGIGVNLTKELAQQQIERAYRGPLPDIPAK